MGQALRFNRVIGRREAGVELKSREYSINDIERVKKLKGMQMLAKLFVSSTVLLTQGIPKTSADDSKELPLEGLYVDNIERFAIVIPPAWFPNTKKISASKLTRYQSEDILLTATCFVEGASMSITSTNAPTLLREFNIEWWFAPMKSISDVGTAELIARLLILQRQGEFEKKLTTSEIQSAVMDESKNSVTFTFDTPVVEGVYRRTIAKTIFRENVLSTVWISGLQSVFEGAYGTTLRNIQSSFILL